MRFVFVMEKLRVLCEVITRVLNIIYSNIILKSVKYLNFFVSLPHIIKDFFKEIIILHSEGNQNCTIINKTTLYFIMCTTHKIT
jgi:hypothetical protein